MIVSCTKCQAKFRVADDKIGPRGAKVRCSRCQTVFHVAGDVGAQPGAAPAAPPPVPKAARALSVDLERPLGGAAGSALAPPPDDADPFAAAGFGVGAEPAPFDPFAAPAPAADDPFAQRAVDDPFAAPPPDAPGGGRSEGRPLAVTDLSQLAGPAPDDGGLALEERTMPPPLPPSANRSPLGAFGFDAGDEDPSLALATEPSGVAPAAPPPELPSALERIAAIPSPPAAEAKAAPRPDERSPAARGSRLRAVFVNAIALAALPLLAFAILAVWRREGPLELASLRPATVLATLGRGGAAGPFTAVEIRSGEYEREKGPPLLFVRGKVVSRAPAAVRRVKVLVEIVRAGAVITRGESLAGAVPTAEELYRVVDAAAAAALARTVASRAPAQIRPGDAVPFLVAIADPPAELDGASVRVELAAGAASP